MKKTGILFLLIVFTWNIGISQKTEIHWMSMNEALAAQKKEPKKIFMDAYTDWCGPCKLMDKKTFHNKDLVNYVNEHFYAVKFNAEGSEEITYQDFTYTNPNHKKNKQGRNTQHLFANALKIQGYPSVVFFDEDSNVIAPVVGFKTAPELEIYLKMMVNDDYKKLTTKKTWDAYQKNFEATFKEQE